MKSTKKWKTKKTGKVRRNEMNEIKDPVKINLRVRTKKLTDDDINFALIQHFCPAHCVSLPNLASALELEGGAKQLVKLLQDAGFVNRCAKSEEECLPKKVYLGKNYFKLRSSTHPGNRVLTRFYVTKKGVGYVVEGLKKIGVKVPDQYKKDLFFFHTTRDLKKELGIKAS